MGTGLFGTQARDLNSRAKLLRDLVTRDESNWRGKPAHIIYAINAHLEEYSNVVKKLKEAIGTKPTYRGDFKWLGFVNVNLTAELREAYDQWDIHDEDVWNGLAEYVASGYKVTFSYTHEQGRFTCTFIGQMECGANSGYGVSGFAATAYDALRVTLFKVSVALPSVWSERAVLPADTIG